MAEEVKATEGAKSFAQERGVELSEVSGTGSGGQVTKADVEAHAEAANAPEAGGPVDEPEPMFYAKLNPNHPELGLYAGNVHVGDRTFYPGEAHPSNVVSQSQWESNYKNARSAYEPNIALLVKGGRYDG